MCRFVLIYECVAPNAIFLPKDRWKWLMGSPGPDCIMRLDAPVYNPSLGRGREGAARKLPIRMRSRLLGTWRLLFATTGFPEADARERRQGVIFDRWRSPANPPP